MIYEMSIEGKLPPQQSDKQYVRGEILLCCYLILPVAKSVWIALIASLIALSIEYVLSI